MAANIWNVIIVHMPEEYSKDKGLDSALGYILDMQAERPQERRILQRSMGYNLSSAV